jgi:hypothetical protein
VSKDIEKEIEDMASEEIKTETQTDKILNLASDLTLFHDQNEETYTFLHNETVSLKSPKLKHYLSSIMYERMGKAPNTDALNQAINVLKGNALFKGKKIELHNRIAWHENAIWYDMGNGESVKVTQTGWEITNSPILFRRYNHQEVQVRPLSGGNPKDIYDSLNIPNDCKLLTLVYIITCFIPEIPHPIFHPHGAQGAGKTTLCKVIKKLCDPSTMDVLIMPRDAQQLVQKIAHHHVCLFDNISNMQPWISDILAQACTGAGLSKRQLYTDDDDIIYQFKRVIGLNGINLSITRADLMDRSILLSVDRITPRKRMNEAEFWAAFEEKRPYILGGIFDALSKAISLHPLVDLMNLPRMADFTQWGYVIAEALGHKGDEFSELYQININSQNEEIIQGNTLAQAVIKLLDEKDIWHGYIKSAWDALKEIAFPGSDKPDKYDSTFPLTPRSLRDHLTRIKSNLNDKGITFRTGPHTREGKPITFQKVRNFASPCSHSHKANENNHLERDYNVTICDDNEVINNSSSHIRACNETNCDEREANEAKTHTYLEEDIIDLMGEEVTKCST